MLAKWTMILPFFIVRWIARRRGEQFVLRAASDGGASVVAPYAGTFFYVDVGK